jgi:hypothetical protein
MNAAPAWIAESLPSMLLSAVVTSLREDQPTTMSTLLMLEAVRTGALRSFKNFPEPDASLLRLRLLSLRAEGFVVGTIGRTLRLTPAGEQFLLSGGDYKVLKAWEEVQP